MQVKQGELQFLKVMNKQCSVNHTTSGRVVERLEPNYLYLQVFLLNFRLVQHGILLMAVGGSGSLGVDHPFVPSVVKLVFLLLQLQAEDISHSRKCNICWYRWHC